MCKSISLLGLLLLLSCQSNDRPEAVAFNINSAGKLFSRIEKILAEEDGKFWDHSLSGPIILVDPETRSFYANHNPGVDDFSAYESTYVDTLNHGINIANTALDWKGMRWTMVMLPLPSDRLDCNQLLIHELFHRIQPQIGFDNLNELNNGHLNTYDGRVLLKLEMEALRSALLEMDWAKSQAHIKYALSFRIKRHTSEKIRNAENSLEMNEGLAEYTGLMLSGRNRSQIKNHLVEQIDRFYQNSSFVRSFAYYTLPIYGYLISKIDEDWHHQIEKFTNLTDFIINSFGWSINSASDVQIIASRTNYPYQEIIRQEKERELLAKAKEEQYKQMFFEEPTLKIGLTDFQISFDPSNIVPIDTVGNVYPNLRLTDNWGILIVENDAFLSADWTYVYITPPTEVTNEVIGGIGWTLHLEEGWVIRYEDQNYSLKRN